MLTLKELNLGHHASHVSTHWGAITGSNWWILSGKRTASGKPILTNDPHLDVTTPPMWYEAHLHQSSAPGETQESKAAESPHSDSCLDTPLHVSRLRGACSRSAPSSVPRLLGTPFLEYMATSFSTMTTSPWASPSRMPTLKMLTWRSSLERKTRHQTTRCSTYMTENHKKWHCGRK